MNPPQVYMCSPSLWVISVHQPQASSIMHRTWTGDLTAAPPGKPPTTEWLEANRKVLPFSNAPVE